VDDEDCRSISDQDSLRRARIVPEKTMLVAVDQDPKNRSEGNK